MENHNPYQAPQSDMQEEYDDIPPLYNPNAAALWSILFTPFGAWIHAKNWEAVGEDDLAKQNRWFVIGIVAYIIIGTLVEMLTGIKIPAALNIVLLVIWYSSLGKKQITLFKEELGTDYEKKSLVMPVLVGVFGAIIVLVVVVFIMQFILQAMGMLHPSWLE